MHQIAWFWTLKLKNLPTVGVGGGTPPRFGRFAPSPSLYNYFQCFSLTLIFMHATEDTSTEVSSTEDSSSEESSTEDTATEEGIVTEEAGATTQEVAATQTTSGPPLRTTKILATPERATTVLTTGKFVCILLGIYYWASVFVKNITMEFRFFLVPVVLPSTSLLLTPCQ